MKTHRSAVVLIPPKAIWEPIQAIRRQYDRHLGRWMPHLTLLYPFRDQREFPAALEVLGRVAARLSVFSATLSRFGAFEHGRERYTVWLGPEPEAPMVRVHARLVEVFPDCDDTGRYRGGYHPHLSLGQVLGRERRDEVLTRLGAAWQAVGFTVDALSLIHRQGDQPFRLVESIPLGG